MIRSRAVAHEESHTGGGPQAEERHRTHRAGGPISDQESGPTEKYGGDRDAAPTRVDDGEGEPAIKPVPGRVLKVRGVDCGENDKGVDDLGGGYGGLWNALRTLSG